MSESHPTSTVKWFAQLPKDEAHALIYSLYIPASNPEPNNVLLEASHATTDEAHPSNPVQQSAPVIERMLEITPAHMSNFDGTPSPTSTTSETMSGSSGQKVINKAPCGLCQQRRRKCEIIQDLPKLCKNCKKKGATECPPHIPNTAFKETSASGSESKYQDSTGNAGRNAFVYENGF